MDLSLDAGRLPIEKGFDLSKDDLLRRDIIMTLMCSAPLEFEVINRTYDIDFASYFAEELVLLKQYEEAGLITIDDQAIRARARGGCSCAPAAWCSTSTCASRIPRPSRS